MRQRNRKRRDKERVRAEFRAPAQATELDSDASLALHERFVGGEQEAGEQFVERLLRYLVGRLGQRFPRAPVDLRTDAVEDALLDHLRRPDRFDRSRGIPIEAYLSFTAGRNLSNSLDREQRRGEREARYAIEAPSISPTDEAADTDKSEALIIQIASTTPSEQAAQVVAHRRTSNRSLRQGSGNRRPSHSAATC
jgi:hypothetical protein